MYKLNFKVNKKTQNACMCLFVFEVLHYNSVRISLYIRLLVNKWYSFCVELLLFLPSLCVCVWAACPSYYDSIPEFVKYIYTYIYILQTREQSCNTTDRAAHTQTQRGGKNSSNSTQKLYHLFTSNHLYSVMRTEL